jgi:hypothetical protein
MRRKEKLMKRILTLLVVSFLFASAGCGAPPDESPSGSPAGGTESLARSSTPGAAELAEKLTHDQRLADESPGSESTGPADVAGMLGRFSNLTVVVRCTRRCIMLCGDMTDEACAKSCCDVTTVN